MLSLILFCLNLSCYFLDNAVKIYPENGYTEMGGCQNFSVEITDSRVKIIKSTIYSKNGTTHVDLYGGNIQMIDTQKKIFLLKYIHSYDSNWVALCDIDGPAEGIYITFTDQNGMWSQVHYSGKIMPDYCTKSHRCTTSSLPKKTYLEETSEFDVLNDEFQITFTQRIDKIKQSVLNFAVCSYSQCSIGDYDTDLKMWNLFLDETEFTLSYQHNRINIKGKPFTKNNHHIIILYNDAGKYGIMKTRLLCSKPIVKGILWNGTILNIYIEIKNKLLLAVSYATFQQGKYQSHGPFLFYDYLPLNLHVENEEYVVVWVLIFVYRKNFEYMIPIYLNMKIDLILKEVYMGTEIQSMVTSQTDISTPVLPKIEGKGQDNHDNGKTDTGYNKTRKTIYISVGVISLIILTSLTIWAAIYLWNN